MQIKVTPNWEAIKTKKQNSIIESHQRENKTRLHHTYNVGDKVLILLKSNDTVLPKMAQPIKGLCVILNIYRNSLVKIRRGNYDGEVGGWEWMDEWGCMVLRVE